jgi:hypothetical protein
MHPPNPKNRGQPRVCLMRWTNTRTHKGLEWFGPPKRNTLLHVSYIAERLRKPVTEWICLYGSSSDFVRP